MSPLSPPLLALSKLFLQLIQDYCLHLCLTGGQEITPPPSSILSSSLLTPVRALPPFLQQQNRETCRLYHTHSVTSAITCGKQLLAGPSRLGAQSRLSTSSGMGLMGMGKMSGPAAPVMLDKEDNSGVCVCVCVCVSVCVSFILPSFPVSCLDSGSTLATYKIHY